VRVRVRVRVRVDEVDVEQLAAQRALLLGLGRRAVVVERVLHRLPIGAHLVRVWVRVRVRVRVGLGLGLGLGGLGLGA